MCHSSSLVRFKTKVKTTVVAIFAALVLGFGLPASPTSAQIEKRDLYIGLLLDLRPEEANAERNLVLLKEEIRKALGANRTVHFLSAHRRFSVDYADYLSLANDPSVDLIIAAGPAGAAMLATQGALPKPTIAVGILDVELQQMPLVGSGVSGVRNFTYVLSTHPIQSDLAAFHRIHPFAHLAVIIGENLKDRLDFAGFFERLAAPYDAQVELVFWGREAALPALSDSVDAVYLIQLTRSIWRWSSSAHPRRSPCWLKPLPERKLPSFAMRRPYVDAGMMACIGDESGPRTYFPQAGPDRRGSRAGRGIGGDARAAQSRRAMVAECRNNPPDRSRPLL